MDPIIPQSDAIRFIKESNGITGIIITDKHIIETLNRKELNPFCAGHFRSFTYVAGLYKSTSFPAPIASKITNTFYSDNALYWLKELHGCITQPLSLHGLISPAEVGCFRNRARITETINPNPDLIPKLMLKWIRNLFLFDESMRSFIAHPERITQGEGEELSKQAYNANLALCCIQPFSDANGRAARIVENIFRLKWHLPWHFITNNTDEEEIYKDDIRRYYRNVFKPEWLNS